MGAGTNAKVFIQMYGLNGKTDELPLKNKSDTFERNTVRIKIWHFVFCKLSI